MKEVDEKKSKAEYASKKAAEDSSKADVELKKAKEEADKAEMVFKKASPADIPTAKATYDKAVDLVT